MSPEFLILLAVILVPIILGVWLHRNIERIAMHLVEGNSEQAERFKRLSRLRADYRSIKQRMQSLDNELVDKRDEVIRLSRHLEKLEDQKIRMSDPLQNIVHEIGTVRSPGVGMLVEAIGPDNMHPFNAHGSEHAEVGKRTCWILAWGADLLDAESALRRSFAQRATVRKVIAKYENQAFVGDGDISQAEPQGSVAGMSPVVGAMK